MNKTICFQGRSENIKVVKVEVTSFCIGLMPIPKGIDDHHGVSAYMGVSTNSRTKNDDKPRKQIKNTTKNVMEDSVTLRKVYTLH